jgi:hypothetical protein
VRGVDDVDQHDCASLQSLAGEQWSQRGLQGEQPVPSSGGRPDPCGENSDNSTRNTVVRTT